MRERHNWATGKHPKTCTCAVCTQRRAEASLPRPPKKSRKPKSQRGKGGDPGGKGGKGKQRDGSTALAEAMDILNRSAASPENDSDTKDTGDNSSDE